MHAQDVGRDDANHDPGRDEANQDDLFNEGNVFQKQSPALTDSATDSVVGTTIILTTHYRYLFLNHAFGSFCCAIRLLKGVC